MRPLKTNLNLRSKVILENFESMKIICDELKNKLNDSLIDLFENGLAKMNSLGIYHCDLKTLNMVYISIL